MRRLVLVLGAGGLLGESMVDRIAPRHEVVARTRAELDVTDSAAVTSTIRLVLPDVVINCSAYTDVDGAEDVPLEALATNSWALRTISRAVAGIDATLVHYSTDFVFDGRTDRPYTELDSPNPRGTYATSKLLGEWFAAEAQRTYVLRVESLFGGHGARQSSIHRLLDGILNSREVRAFTDRTVSPSYVDDVLDATLTLIEGAAPHGLYHCVNTGWTTWLGLAQELAVLAGRPDALITGVPMAESGLKAPRPRFAALSNRKLAQVGIEMPTWQDALRRYVQLVRAGTDELAN